MAEFKTIYNTPLTGSLAYDYSNVAVQPEFGRVKKPDRKVVIPAPPIVGEQVSTRAKIKTQQAIAPFAIIGFACAAVLLVFLLMASIQLTAATDTAVKLESQLQELQMSQSRLLIDYETAFNLTKIDDYATSTLGMQRPREEQVIYLNSSVPDKAVVLDGEQDGYGFTDRVSDFLKSIGEYFK